jgi:hypothetical protein
MLECGNAGFDPLQTWDVQCNRLSGCRMGTGLLTVAKSIILHSYLFLR